MTTTEAINSVPPYVFEQKGTFDAPFEFDVPASLEVRPETATAKFDGTGASGSFLACLTFYGSDGERLGRWFNPTVLAPGSKAEVTFTPPFGSAATNVTPSGVSGVFEVIDGSTVPVNAPANGNGVGLKWASGAGGTASLLDYTNPVEPTVKTDGIYAFAITVFKADAIFNDVSQMFATLQLDFLSLQVQTNSGGLCLLDTTIPSRPGFAVAVPQVSLAQTRSLLAGATLFSDIKQGSGAIRPFYLQGVVELIV